GASRQYLRPASPAVCRAIDPCSCQVASKYAGQNGLRITRMHSERDNECAAIPERARAKRPRKWATKEGPRIALIRRFKDADAVVPVSGSGIDSIGRRWRDRD